MKQKYTKKQLEVELAMLRISYEVEIAKKIMEHQRYVKETEEKIDNLQFYMGIGGLIVIVCVASLIHVLIK